MSIPGLAAAVILFAAAAQPAGEPEPAAHEAEPAIQESEPAAVFPASGPVLLPETEAPGRLERTAETYAAYHGDVSTAGLRELRSGADLDATMDALAGYYEGDQLVDAQIAYAALVAAQHPEFIDAVRAVADYYGAGTARAALLNDPYFITGFMGADIASDSVMTAIEEDVGRIREVGDRYRQAAYDLQRETWAQRRARDRQERLSALESASDRLQVRFRAENSNGGSSLTGRERRLGSASALFDDQQAGALPALPDLQVRVGEAQMTPDERKIGRMLSVAALQSIESGDMSALDLLLDDPGVARCIGWARLNLAQCVAAGHFKYEDSFCIAQHALHDVAQCLTAVRPAPAASVSN